MYQISEQNQEERLQPHFDLKDGIPEPKVMIEDSDYSTGRQGEEDSEVPTFSYYSKSLQFVHCFCRIPIKEVENFMDLWSEIEEMVKEFLRSKKAKILHSKEFHRELRFYFVVGKQGFEQS